LWLDDDVNYKMKRIQFFFNFGDLSKLQNDHSLNDIISLDPLSSQIQPNSASQRQVLYIFTFMMRCKDTNPIFLLSMLNFMGKLATREPNGG
jgi:hypothetical protein